MMSVIEKRNIGIVVNSSWNIINFRLRLMDKLRERGHRIIVICPADQGIEPDALNADEVFELKWLTRNGLNPLIDTMLCMELIHAMRRHKIDILLNYTIKPALYGSLAARLLGKSVINTITGLGSVFVSNSPLKALVVHMYRLMISERHKVFFQNKDDRNLFLNLGIVSEANSEVVPGSGIDIVQFPFVKMPNRNGSLVVVFVGRILRDKGVNELFEAACLLRDRGFHQEHMEIHVVGDIDPNNPASLTKEELEVQIEKSKVIYHGRMDFVVDIIATSHAVILPSYREGLPRVMLEAMSVGRPIITTDVPGCRDVVEHGINGLMIPPRNSQALADALEELHSLPLESLQRMGSSGRTMVEERFKDDIVNDRYVTVIENHL